MTLDELDIKEEIVNGNTYVTFNLKEKIHNTTRKARYSFRYIPVPSNCKFNLIDGVNISLGTPERAQAFLKVLKEKFPHRKMLHMTITSLDALQNVKKFFKVVYIAKVPYGYGEAYQYHTVITTTDANCPYFKRAEKEPITIIANATKPIIKSPIDVGSTIVCGTDKYKTFLKGQTYSIRKIKNNSYYIFNDHWKLTKINLKKFENK